MVDLILNSKVLFITVSKQSTLVNLKKFFFVAQLWYVKLFKQSLWGKNNLL